MFFAETFKELRKRRRLPMTMWEGGDPPIPSSYINDIEKNGLIPSKEKLDKLVSVFAEVASDQGADPEADVQILRRERERSFLVERAKLEPEVAEVCLHFRELIAGDLPDSERDEVLDVFNRAVQAFSDFEPAIRGEFMQRLHGLVDELEGRPIQEAECEVQREPAVR